MTPQLEQLIKHYESLHDGDLSAIGLQPKMDCLGIWTDSALLIVEIKKLKDANPQADFSDIIKEAKKNLEEKIG